MAGDYCSVNSANAIKTHQVPRKLIEAAPKGRRKCQSPPLRKCPSAPSGRSVRIIGEWQEKCTYGAKRPGSMINPRWGNKKGRKHHLLAFLTEINESRKPAVSPCNELFYSFALGFRVFPDYPIAPWIFGARALPKQKKRALRNVTP